MAFLSSQLNAGKLSENEDTVQNDSQTKQVITQSKLPDNKTSVTQQESDKLNIRSAVIEPVSNVSYDGTTLTFTAISNGCTSPEHFTIEDHTDAERCQLTITRTQPDYCRKVPQAVEVTLPWSRPEGAQCRQLVIANPLLETALAKRLNK